MGCLLGFIVDGMPAGVQHVHGMPVGRLVELTMDRDERPIGVHHGWEVYPMGGIMGHAVIQTCAAIGVAFSGRFFVWSTLSLLGLTAIPFQGQTNSGFVPYTGRRF